MTMPNNECGEVCSFQQWCSEQLSLTQQIFSPHHVIAPDVAPVLIGNDGTEEDAAHNGPERSKTSRFFDNDGVPMHDT